jgi:hypothetical protein
MSAGFRKCQTAVLSYKLYLSYAIENYVWNFDLPDREMDYDLSLEAIVVHPEIMLIIVRGISIDLVEIDSGVDLLISVASVNRESFKIQL